jgi:hypothetical protein
MAIFNPFNNDAYSLVSLTDSINVIPINYGLVNKLGIFDETGVRTNTALIERRNGILNLIPSVPVGGPPSVNTNAKRDLLALPIPHIPVVDVVLPADVQGIRAFGTENALETIDGKIADKMAEMSRKQDITLEYLRVGALRGIVTDGDGSTVLAHMFTAFGITQKVINIPLSVSSTSMIAAGQNITRYFEDNLNGETMDEVVVLCSGGFWDSFVGHPNITAAYNFFMAQSGTGNPLRDDLRQGFVYQGVRFIEYRGKASLPGGSVVNFIPAGEAIAFPMGTTNVFHTYFAPGNFVETVNTLGLRKYMKQEPKRMGQGWDLWVESNPLPICARPDLLVRLTQS